MAWLRTTEGDFVNLSALRKISVTAMSINAEFLDGTETHLSIKSLSKDYDGDIVVVTRLISPESLPSETPEEKRKNDEDRENQRIKRNAQKGILSY
jgi:hypothetical protein